MFLRKLLYAVFFGFSKLSCRSQWLEKFERLLNGELRFLLRNEMATLFEFSTLDVLRDRLPHRYDVAHKCFATPSEQRHF